MFLCKVVKHNSRQVLQNHKFWNLSNGKSIGFIESVYRGGLFIHSDFASFRETSSNLATGEAREFSITKLSKEDREKLDYVLSKKIPVEIKFSKDFLGSPFRGDLMEPRYIHSLKLLGDEKINVDLK